MEYFGGLLYAFLLVVSEQAHCALKSQEHSTLMYFFEITLTSTPKNGRKFLLVN